MPGQPLNDDVVCPCQFRSFENEIIESGASPFGDGSSGKELTAPLPLGVQELSHGHDENWNHR